MFGYYTPGEKRVHRVLEGELFVLYNAGLALIQLEDEGITGRRGMRMQHEVRVDLERAITHARELIDERRKFG